MKEKVSFTKFQKFIECITLLVLLGSIIYLAVSWDSIPSIIPSHFNAKGIPDDWSGKGSLLAMPIISIILYTLLTTITFFPSIWNTPVEVTEKNRTFVHDNLRTMVCILKLIIISDFAYISVCAATQQGSLSSWFLPILLISTFGTLTIFITRIVKGNKHLK
ncbi:MAG: DUF1648 domain-containing protein [Clostridium sp.]|uniref:DUF1648 domain-containing protein n=1 Tax=Clostridium sp. TaxID=1506 RepID=UPI003044FF80